MNDNVNPNPGAPSFDEGREIYLKLCAGLVSAVNHSGNEAVAAGHAGIPLGTVLAALSAVMGHFIAGIDEADRQKCLDTLPEVLARSVQEHLDFGTVAEVRDIAKPATTTTVN